MAVNLVLTAVGGLYLEKNVQNKSNRLYLLLMVITITIAIILFKMDISKIGCDPESFFQAHSLWHIFNSFTVFYIYLYFRSENYKPSEDKKIAHLREKI